MIFLTQIRKFRNFLVTPLLAMVLGGLFFVPSQVWASTYGSGDYGDCEYGNSCPSQSSSSSGGGETTTAEDSNDEILLNNFSEFFGDEGKQLTLEPGQVVNFDVITDGETQHKSITIV